MLGYQLTCQAEVSVCEHVGAPDPLLTQGGPVTFLACALHQLFVRSCDLAEHGLCCSPLSMFVHTTAPRSICLFGVLLSLSFCAHMGRTSGACGCLLAPLSGITLTTRVIRSQHNTLFNSYKLFATLPVSCAVCRPQHESHMVRRLQVLCPAHSSHSVLPIHRFRWTDHPHYHK